VGAGGGSGSGGQESGEDLRECGFADPVVPDQADEAGGDGGGQLGEDLGVVAEAAVQSRHSDGSGQEGPHFVHAEPLRVRGTRRSRYEDSLHGRPALRRRWDPIIMTDSARRVKEAGSRTSGPQTMMSMSSAGRSWGLASWCGTSPGACAQSPACSVV